MKKIIIFTDLDGTLLDHEDYSYDEAKEAMDLAKSLDVPLIFNTSKTLKEVQRIQRELDIHSPFVIENGGAIWIPQGEFDNDEAKLVLLGESTDRIEMMAEKLRQNFRFRGFSEMSCEEVSDVTGLTLGEAELARRRMCSEPLVWLDNQDRLSKFEEELNLEGFRLFRGGRFYHITGKSCKGAALKYLKDCYMRKYNEEPVALALGDSMNDLPMLLEADLAVAVNKIDGTHLEFEGGIYPELPGPSGWNKAVLEILNAELNK